MSSKKKGTDFENRVGAVLEDLKNRHSDRVRVMAQPRFKLYDGRDVIPDYELQVDLPFAEKRYLIECQDRKRSAPGIAQKIKYIKGLSERNSFIFVFADSIPEATRDALTADGVIAASFEEFVAFIARLEATMRETRSISRVQDNDVMDDFKRRLRRKISDFDLHVDRWA